MLSFAFFFMVRITVLSHFLNLTIDYQKLVSRVGQNSEQRHFVSLWAGTGFNYDTLDNKDLSPSTLGVIQDKAIIGITRDKTE